MAAEQRPSSEATVKLPRSSAEATVQTEAPRAEVSPPPAPQPEADVVGTAHPTKVVRAPLSALEKAQRRLIKNLIMSGVFVVVLVTVFYYLSR